MKKISKLLIGTNNKGKYQGNQRLIAKIHQNAFNIGI